MWVGCPANGITVTTRSIWVTNRTCKHSNEKREGSMKQTHHAAKLERRLKAYDSIRNEGGGNRPGSKYVKNGHGKAVMYHKPGSLKK